MVRLIKGESDLATLHPDLVKEWHPIKNGDLMPEDISSGSGKEVWWLCPEGTLTQWQLIKEQSEDMAAHIALDIEQLEV